ncbi:hypothetical protein AVEN_269717-1 [Araneus ventricosus]|uniref:Uncharacterized protein n=1 Tax=Araneus ventricosus TaxID=182803 RepID=A0A4Y2KRH3_ARAVE|nr:hypothetical protein AVEN_269717-1 [Araneus ventricosus]
MTRTTPELAPPLQTSVPHQREDVWPLRMIELATGSIQGGSSLESGFGPATLRSRGRGLTTRPPPPLNITVFLRVISTSYVKDHLAWLVVLGFIGAMAKFDHDAPNVRWKYRHMVTIWPVTYSKKSAAP